ncbi:hypothetical protein EKI60_00560 [Candidatus Saccharibacteria bacterium]|nr:MAG: hypothetical protein EKI60_00560 [Candidatus Saccharibacteria bacterium]
MTDYSIEMGVARYAALLGVMPAIPKLVPDVLQVVCAQEIPNPMSLVTTFTFQGDPYTEIMFDTAELEADCRTQMYGVANGIADLLSSNGHSVTRGILLPETLGSLRLFRHTI